MAEVQMVAPMVVRRRFKGPTLAGDDGVFWHMPGSVVDVAEWRNAGSLERGGYLRKLEYGEQIVPAGSVHQVAKGAGAKVAEGERASSSQDSDSDAPAPSSDPAPDEDEDEGEGEGGDEDEGEGEGGEDEGEADDDGGDDAPVLELEHVGGGWYNVVVDGAVKNTNPIQGKDAAQEFADDL